MLVSFIWNLTRVAELSKTKTTGSDIARSSIAVSSNQRLDPTTNKYISDTSFYNLEAYKWVALRLAKYPKGTLVYVEGDLTNVSYKAEDGTNKSYLKIIVSNIVAIRYVSDAELGLGNQVPQTATVTPVTPVYSPASIPTVPPTIPVTTPINPITPNTTSQIPKSIETDIPLSPIDGGVSFDFSNVK